MKKPKKSPVKNAKNKKKIVPQTNRNKGSKGDTIKKDIPPKTDKSDTIKRRIAAGKKRMIESLVKTLGIVTTAVKLAKISRDTHYSWMKDDPEYKAAVEDVDNIAIDFVESQFHKRIQAGDTVACIFYLKTKAKKRGYIERVEVKKEIVEDLDIPVIDWVSTKKPDENKK